MIHKLLFLLFVASTSKQSLVKPCTRFFIDHCNVDFHWVRHRNITIKIGFVQDPSALFSPMHSMR